MGQSPRSEQGFALTADGVVSMISADPMSEEPNPDFEESPTQPFRWNGKVLQMVSLVLVALALPMTMAIYGFREIRKASEPFPDAAGLRAVLENVVDEQWQAPVLEGAAPIFMCEVSDEEACLKAGETIQNVVRNSGGVVLTPEKIESGGTRWLVQIPGDRAVSFETELAEAGFSSPKGDRGGAPFFYSIEIPISR
jgi:hypothetical protein